MDYLLALALLVSAPTALALAYGLLKSRKRCAALQERYADCATQLTTELSANDKLRDSLNDSNQATTDKNRELLKTQEQLAEARNALHVTLEVSEGHAKRWRWKRIIGGKVVANGPGSYGSRHKAVQAAIAAYPGCAVEIAQ